MRGRLIVLVMIALALIMLALQIWVVNDQRPVDEQFDFGSRRREKLESVEAPGPMLLREQVGEFVRKSFEPVEIDPLTGERTGKAVYAADNGDTITLEVETRQPAPGIEAVFADFAARAGGEATLLKLHPETASKGYAYGYGVYASPMATYYELAWINGNWIIRAWTRQASGLTLVRFANNFPH